MSIVCAVLYNLSCAFFSHRFMLLENKPLRFVLTATICIMYSIFNNPSVNLRIYQAIYYHGFPTALLLMFAFARNFICILFLINIFSNNIVLLRNYRNTTMWLKKWHVSSYNIYLLFLNVIFALMITQDMIWSTNSVKLAKCLLAFSKNSYFMSATSYTLLGAIICSLSVFMLFSVFHYKTFGSIIKVKGFFLNRNAQKTKKQIRTYFHSFKNHLLAVESLCSRAIAAESPALKNELLNKINTLSQNSMVSITSMLNSFNGIDLDERNDDIISCIETAIICSNIPEDIKILKLYNTNFKILKFDYFHLNEMFKNIFCNAADAIKASNRKDGTITIEINSDKDIFEISIRDNGIGMDKKTKRQMFKPLYTTKIKKNYWGIGMFYVHNVVASHGGFIRVVSSPEKGTQISIFFPCNVGNKERNMI